MYLAEVQFTEKCRGDILCNVQADLHHGKQKLHFQLGK